MSMFTSLSMVAMNNRLLLISQLIHDKAVDVKTASKKLQKTRSKDDKKQDQKMTKNEAKKRLVKTHPVESNIIITHFPTN